MKKGNQAQVRKAGKLANSTRLLIKEMNAGPTDLRRLEIFDAIIDNALEGCMVAMLYNPPAPR